MYFTIGFGKKTTAVYNLYPVIHFYTLNPLWWLSVEQQMEIKVERTLTKNQGLPAVHYN